MRAQKRDENESWIIEALTQIECVAEQLPGGNGRPDLLVADKKSGATFLIEVKGPGQTLNALQKKWHTKWPGKLHIARTPADVVLIVAYHRGSKS
jgi:hypothetical protein